MTATWRRDGDSYVLNGDYRYVIDGHTADLLIVAAGRRVAAASRVSACFCCLRTRRGDAAVAAHHGSGAQAGGGATARCECLATALMGEAGQAWTALHAVIDLATIALAAEQVGGCQQLLDMTVEYTERAGAVQSHHRQLPGGQAQGGRHDVEDRGGALGDLLRRLCRPGSAGGWPAGGELGEAASVAKSYCSDAYFAIAGDALQLFGGVGFTWEYDVHLYFKRAKSSEHLLGNGALHRERLAALLLDEGENV